jgi:hypothetical protein
MSQKLRVEGVGLAVTQAARQRVDWIPIGRAQLGQDRAGVGPTPACRVPPLAGDGVGVAPHARAQQAAWPKLSRRAGGQHLTAVRADWTFGHRKTPTSH